MTQSTDRTTIKGFGPFVEEVTVEWDALGPLIALTGENGAGKTTLLNARFIARYGYCPARGSIFDAMSTGASEAYIEDVATHGGKTYMIRRTVKGKNKTHACNLWEVGEDFALALLAGPNVKECGTKIAEIFGSDTFALATGFSAQGGSGDLCAIDPSGRREVFAELLGFGELQKLSDAAKLKAKGSRGEAEALEGQLIGQPDHDANILAAAQEAEQAEKDAQEATARLAEPTGRRDSLKDSLATLEAGQTQHNAAIERHTLALSEAERADAAKASAFELVGKSNRAEGELPALRLKVNQRETAERRETELIRQQAEARAWADWNRDRAGIEKDLASDRAWIETMRTQTGVTEETRALAARLPEIESDYRTKKGENDATDAFNAGATEKRSNLEVRLAANSGTLAEIEARLGAAAKPPCGADPAICGTCSLFAEVAGLNQRKADLLETKARLQTELAGVEALRPLHDLSGLIKEGEAARAAAQKIADAANAEEGIKQHEASIAHLTAQLGAHDATEPTKVDAPDEAELAEVRQTIKALEGSALKLDAAQVEAGLLGVRETAHRAAVEAAKEAAGRAETLKAAADAARAALAGEADTEKRIRETIAEVDREISGINETIKGLREKAANAAGRIEQMKLAKAALAETREKAEAARAKTNRLDTLAAIFGPRGVQAMLIEAMAPRLDQIAAEMLNDATDGRMALRICTQEETASGKREAFLIMVTDDMGERDVSTYSGGEKRMLQTILRLAVTEYQCELHGRREGHVRIDESFDALDDRNKALMIELLQKMAVRYERVIVITHDAAIADQFPAHIRLEKFSGAGVVLAKQAA